MKISALFLDYDGTVAPAYVKREESSVPPGLYSTLERISSKIPVAMITAKDLEFVMPRTGFAWAWSGALGLETRTREGKVQMAKVEGDLGAVVGDVRKTLPAGIIVEEKRATDGTLLGASIDWSRMEEAPIKEIEGAQRAFSGKGFQTDREDQYRFMDVYAAHADKGVALRGLMQLLKVSPPVMYMGDSPPDNRAFEEADVSICVNHGRRDWNLRCQFAVEYDEVERMLSSLLADGFEFGPAVVQSGGAS